MRKFLLNLLLSILGLACPTSLYAQLTVQGSETNVPYSGTTAFVIANTPVNPNLLTSTGQNTFIMNVSAPQNAVRVYITNDTANACANLTLTLGTTGNSSLNSFNQNPQAWQSISAQVGASGTFLASNPLTLPASQTLAITSQTLVAGKLVIFLVLSSGCATTNIDMQVVFGPFNVTSPNIQGVVANGAAAGSVNPVLIGGMDVNNHAQVLCASNDAISCPGSPAAGSFNLSLGARAGLGSNFTGMATQSPDGIPLATFPNFSRGGLGASSAGFVGGSSSRVCTTGASCPGLFVGKAGWGLQFTMTAQSSTFNVNEWQGWTDGGVLHACRVDVVVTAASGTTPTLDVFLQDSADNVAFTDRIHLAQITATASEWASISADTSTVSTSYTNGTLAASTNVNGMIAQFGRLRAVIGGTTPSFTGTLTVTCE